MINEEGGIDVEEFRFASIVDRVAHHRDRLARPDRPVCPVPHPQVRPDHPARVLPVLRLPQQRRRARARPSPTPPSRPAAPTIAARDRRARSGPGRPLPAPRRLGRTGTSLVPTRLESRRRARRSTIRPDGSVVASGTAADERHLSRSSSTPIPDGRSRRSGSRRSTDPTLPASRARADAARQLRRHRVQGRGRADRRRRTEADRVRPRPTADVAQPEFRRRRRHRRRPRDRLGDRRRLGPPATSRTRPTFTLKEPLEVGRATPADDHARPALRRRPHARPVPDLGRKRRASRGRPEPPRRRARAPDRGEAGRVGDGAQAASDWSVAADRRASSRRSTRRSTRGPTARSSPRGDKPNNDVYEVDLDGDFAGDHGHPPRGPARPDACPTAGRAAPRCSRSATSS